MRYILFCILLLKGEKIFELFLSEVFRTAASSIGDSDTRSILISFLAISIPLSIGWIQYFGNYILTNIFETILLLIWWMRLYETGKIAPWRVILRKTGSRWYNTLGSFRGYYSLECYRLLIQLFRERLSEKNVHATIPKGNIGYDQYAVANKVAVESSIVAFL